jgi:hypothetical protein
MEVVMGPEQTPTAPEIGLLIPRPRTAVGETLRRFVPAPRVTCQPDLDALCAMVSQVAVWTSRSGTWQENATFLLTTQDGNRHLVAFGDAFAGELIARLRELPGFATDRLLELISSNTEQITVIWRRPLEP